jgi:DNA polymerase-1
VEREVIPTPNRQELDLIILDSYSLLFRAYHSFPLSLKSPAGQITNAVYGFTRMLLRVFELIKPQYFVAARDMGEPTFRHQAYTDYKANREEADIELKQQFPLMAEMLSVLNIPTIGIDGFEADDIIGTLSEKLTHENPGLKVGIFTSDRDMFQLIHDHVFLLWPERDGSGDLTVIGHTEAYEKLLVHPDQVVDYKALCGDSSDNIPGVRGIGPKTAVKLLGQYETLEGIYAHAHEHDDIPPIILKKLLEGEENAWLSQKLAKIDTQVPLDFTLESARLCDYDKNEALQLFTQLGFESLKRKLPNDSFEDQVQASLFG